jgi:hypothetical protein
MRRNNIFFLFLLFSFYGCAINDEQGFSENNIDAASSFIRNALDGKFNEAKLYLLQDSANLNYMDVAERNYQKADQLVKDGYRSSSINIHLVEPVNDSTSIVIYSNSFKKDKDTLKVIRLNDKWMVDLKYLYEHNADNMQLLQPKTDTLK